jgi:transposase
MPKTHKPYDKEFKRQAVDLYLSSGKSIKQVSRELGVSDGSLRKWQKDLFGGNGGQGGVSRERDESLAGMDPEEMAKEIRRLNQENAYLRRQREILKKAASILAEDPQLGMR